MLFGLIVEQVLTYNPCAKESILRYIISDIFDVLNMHRLLKGRTVYSAARGLELVSQNEIGCLF